ncbi:hypothetical protein BO71DRAFT_169981 [Aspergillus ellipticus CBS 707.79]|uniref:Uncharacterized protein n=1 Tax=Aspergillus ellipticus CBS 707.79 TaxID=1448320 RepID=A0A319DPK8_9EURO|nr:hypothetical protein BO71DRAFT_169981 [Aspergillus ellipticus CBS 707.79]
MKPRDPLPVCSPHPYPLSSYPTRDLSAWTFCVTLHGRVRLSLRALTMSGLRAAVYWHSHSVHSVCPQLCNVPLLGLLLAHGVVSAAYSPKEATIPMKGLIHEPPFYSFLQTRRGFKPIQEPFWFGSPESSYALPWPDR